MAENAGSDGGMSGAGPGGYGSDNGSRGFGGGLGSDSLGSGLSLGSPGIGLGAGYGYSDASTLGQGMSLGTGLTNAAGDSTAPGGVGMTTGGNSLGAGIGDSLGGLAGMGLGLSPSQSSALSAAIAKRESVPATVIDAILGFIPAIGIPNAIAKKATDQSIGTVLSGLLSGGWSSDSPSSPGGGFSPNGNGGGGNGGAGGMLTGSPSPQSIIAANSPTNTTPKGSVNSVGLFNSPMSQSTNSPEYIQQSIPVTPMSFYERIYGKQAPSSVVGGLFSGYTGG